jgi:hypothetical protein
MNENSRRNKEAAERAERYLKEIPPHLLGRAGRILVSNPPPSAKPDTTEPPSLRGIEGRRTKRQSPSQSPSQSPLLVSVPSD